MTRLDNPEEMTDEELNETVSVLTRAEETGILSAEGEYYLAKLRTEVLKRASVGGPFAEYTGPE